MLKEAQVQQYRTQGYCTGRLLSREAVGIFFSEIERISAGATLAHHDPERLEMEPSQPQDGTGVRRIYEPCTYLRVVS